MLYKAFVKFFCLAQMIALFTLCRIYSMEGQDGQMEQIEHEKAEVDNCPICLHELPIASNDVLNLDCKHSYCRICIREWAKIQIIANRVPKCPYCTGPLPENEIADLKKRITIKEQFISFLNKNLDLIDRLIYNPIIFSICMISLIWGWYFIIEKVL